MHRFFVNDESIGKDTIRISGDDVNHISKVLRLRVKEHISISDGKGTEYLCSISSINRDYVICDILEKNMNITESPVKVDLYQGIPKSTKMDLIVQKCVELGVNRIFPVDTERVVVKATEERGFSNKIVRWQKIAEEAAKQSARGKVPVIENSILFNETLEKLKEYDLCLIPYEKENSTGLKHVLKGKNNIKKVAVIIGPEGGFSEDEIKKAEESGAVPVTLGPRILRTETAGFVSLAIILYELGDMGGETWEK
jgi:16S rRNA (uracil1498-N3)-methyltransferase